MKSILTKQSVSSFFGDIIWQPPWILFKRRKEVKRQIRALPRYLELKAEEGILARSIAVVTVLVVVVLTLLVFFALT